MTLPRDAKIQKCERARLLYGNARISTQRAVIAQCILDHGGTFTAEDLHTAVSEHSEGIGLATVYRALVAMHSAGTIAQVGQRSGSALLTHCNRQDHHHHLVCEICGDVVAIDCPIDHNAMTWPGEGGVITRHEVTLFGICPTCAAREGSH